MDLIDRGPPKLIGREGKFCVGMYISGSIEIRPDFNVSRSIDLLAVASSGSLGTVKGCYDSIG